LAAPEGGRSPNQFDLLRQRRFAPFFWTQFCGAANDNLFKFAFTVMVTYQLSVDWLPPALAGLVIGALFILPYVLFSATSGQLADKLEKTRLIRFVKNLEIAIMGAAAWGFWSAHVPTLLLCTFLMGLHSTVFGPVKYALLPQVLDEHELTGGNGMVEMGTFVAILLGNLAGGLLVVIADDGRLWVAVACVALAVVGRLAAARIPALPATAPELTMNWNPITESWRNLRLASAQPEVFRSMLGISWMWFFGAVFLSQFPSFAKLVLHGDEHVASLLLVLFSIGIGTGALLCETLSKGQVDIGLVPLGAIGMSVFSIDLYAATSGGAATPVMGVQAFVAQAAHWRVMADLLMLSLCTGLFSVPMYALIQLRSPATHRARIIAANNILNALFMVVSAVLAGALLQSGWQVPQIFLTVGCANGLAILALCLWMPEYALRCGVWLMARITWRLRIQGEDQLSKRGANLVFCTSGRWLGLLLLAASPRPMVFMVDAAALGRRLPKRVWEHLQVIALPLSGTDPSGHEYALRQARHVLAQDRILVVCEPRDAADDLKALMNAQQPLQMNVVRFDRQGRQMRLLVSEPLQLAGLETPALQAQLSALLAGT
jgi:MFS family permease